MDPIGLKPGMKVLDIGSGTGGSAFFMAQTYGVEVLGIDLTPNMLAIANEHKATFDADVQNLVTFRYLDATKAEFPEGHFDLVYSRDAIMHIFEKESLYRKILVSLFTIHNIPVLAGNSNGVSEMAQTWRANFDF